MLRTLPTTVGACLPQSDRKGVILSRRQALAKCRPSPQSRRLRLQISSVESKHDHTGISLPQDPTLRSVRSVLQDGLCPAACQGVVQLNSPLAIYGRGQNGRLFDVQLPPPPDGAALQSLLKLAVPAADELSIASKEFATTLDIYEHSILQDVHTLLVPKAQSIRAHLHQLMVHAPGGLYHSCKDPPRSSDQFGSLVVCLPALCKGGAFVVCLNGSEKARTGCLTVDAAVNIRVCWTAFSTDCEHKVETVVKGHRITLHYSLTADTTEYIWNTPPVVALSTATSRPLYGALQAALNDPAVLPAGGTLGIACSQEYFKLLSELHGQFLSQEMLKGGDAIAYVAARQLQLQPKLKLIFDEKCATSTSEELGSDRYQILGSHVIGVLDGTDVEHETGPSGRGFTRAVLEDEGAATGGFVVWLNADNLCFEFLGQAWSSEPWDDIADVNQLSVPGMDRAFAILLPVPVDGDGRRAHVHDQRLAL